jgi:hypothetical protein
MVLAPDPSLSASLPLFATTSIGRRGEVAFGLGRSIAFASAQLV